MPTFVYDPLTGRTVDKATGFPMIAADAPFQPVTPMTVPDIAPYLSPVDGRYIGGRRSKRADLDRHNCVDAADLPSPTGGKFRNREFAAKRGMTDRLIEGA